MRFIPSAYEYSMRNAICGTLIYIRANVYSNKAGVIDFKVVLCTKYINVVFILSTHNAQTVAIFYHVAWSHDISPDIHMTINLIMPYLISNGFQFSLPVTYACLFSIAVKHVILHVISLMPSSHPSSECCGISDEYGKQYNSTNLPANISLAETGRKFFKHLLKHASRWIKVARTNI